jgi:hypothetical protein
MHKTIQPIITFLLCFLLSAWCSGQTVVYYKYNADGSRKLRTTDITLKSAKEARGDLAQNENKAFLDSIGSIKILIYPNPTHGQIKIEITGADFSKKSGVYLYNTSGTLLQQKVPASGNDVIDLSLYPSNIYLMRIMLNGKTSEWKILKE